MSKTILIVDDSRALRSIINLNLTRAGFSVLEAGDGVEALAVLDKTPKVHLIVSDVNMPNMNGFDFANQVKTHPKHRFAPVIMLTTEKGDDKKQLGKAAGARAWIVKPFQPQQLLDAVNKLILA